MESARPGSRSFHSTASVLPGQAMASVEELKKELELNSENSALKLSILTSLITKVEGSEKVQFLKQKIHDLIELNAPHEASIDIESLLALENSEETQHLNCSLLFMKKDYVNCMTKLLRSKNHSELFDKTIEHLLDSSFFDTLYVIPNLPDLYSSQMTFFPELRGKVVLQICSSSYQTYILISTCPHFAYKTACPKGLYNCSEELQLLEVSNSILTPVDFLSNQKLEMVSCSDYMTGVLHRSGRITLWGELPNGETHQIIEYPCREIAVGSKFALFVNDESIGFWGKLSGLDSNSEVICIAENSGNVKCSDFHVMLLSNGKVACLGIGEEGQLGLGDLTVANEFTSVDIELNVDQILCNNEVSVAITREVIYVWGMINPLQLHSDSPIAWKPVILDCLDLEYVCATLSKFEMLILGKDNILYSWIWKEDTKVKKYRRLDINGVAMLSLRGSEAFLIKRVAIPQLTQVISYPQNAYSNVPFSVILTLHDQFGPGYIPDALISFGFTKEKANEVNEIEYDFRMSDDDETTIIIVTPFSFGDYWMHIYVEKQEIYSSPLKVSIAPSPTEEVLLIKTDELKQLEKMVSIKRTERALKREQEKKKAVEDRAVKMERTRKRAQEALKNYLETKESEIIANAKMLQRKATTKKTGGGYIISD